MNKQPNELVVCLKRLEQAKRYIELARVSRQVAYGAVPYLLSAELLLDKAIIEQGKHT
jgi:hypothetical protein